MPNIYKFISKTLHGLNIYYERSVKYSVSISSLKRLVRNVMAMRLFKFLLKYCSFEICFIYESTTQEFLSNSWNKEFLDVT